MADVGWVSAGVETALRIARALPRACSAHGSFQAMSASPPRCPDLCGEGGVSAQRKDFAFAVT